MLFVFSLLKFSFNQSKIGLLRAIIIMIGGSFFKLFLIAHLVEQVLLVELSFTNSCPQTVWLASAPNSNQPKLPGGSIKLNSGAKYVYQIPNSGWAGRFWPKINCDGSGEACEFGQSSPPCPAKGCQPPADTKVEFLFPPQPPRSDSWYDISLVDGYSLPMKIVPRGINQGACVSTDCAMSLNQCPTNEKFGIGDLRIWSNGKVVGCLSPCKKWNFPAPYGYGRPELNAPGVNMCCPTPPISPQQCSSGIVIQTDYVNSIHAHCPSAYSYAYDDAAGLHNCPGATSFDVTFCPGGSSSPSAPCTQWGWQFYDGYDIVSSDLSSMATGDRNQCQDACRNRSGCKSYTWFNGVCYFKAATSPIVAKAGCYSAVLC